MSGGERYLVADIGGTNARFALADETGALSHQAAWLTALYAGLEEALTAYLDQHRGIAIAGAAVCAAGPLEPEGDAINMTNCPWQVTKAAISAATGVAAPVLVNDFTAVALSIPHLKESERRQIGAGAPETGKPLAVLGPGTGLGVSGLIPCGGGLDSWHALSGEGGHVDLAPANAREISVIYQLLQDFGHASAETVLSGPGLENLYLALAALDGAALPRRPDPGEIARQAREKSSPIAVETVELFCGWLGAVAGNLALTLGAKGGVYIAGGIVPRWGDLFDEARFRYRFEAKGRFKAYLEPIPTYVITAEQPALAGLAAAARAAAHGSS